MAAKTLSIKKKLLFLLICCALLSFPLEWVLRRALLTSYFIDRFSFNDSASWRLRWIKNQRANTSPYQAIDQYDFLRGWTLKPNLRDKLLTSNARGLRGSVEHAYERNGAFRVLVFGDSFTFGEGVADNETYAHLLDEALPKVEVLNFGVHGYAHDQMLLYLKSEGVKYKPDVVILGFVGVDIDRNLVRFRDYAKPRFDYCLGALHLTHVPVPRPREILAAEGRRLKLGDVLTMIAARLSYRFGLASVKKYRLTAALLDEFRKTVEECGARPLFVYLPVGHEIKPRDQLTKTEKFFARYCAERGVRHINLRPDFQAAAKAGQDFGGGHWNAQGHRLVAQRIKAYLLSEKLMTLK